MIEPIGPEKPARVRPLQPPEFEPETPPGKLCQTLLVHVGGAVQEGRTRFAQSIQVDAGELAPSLHVLPHPQCLHHGVLLLEAVPPDLIEPRRTDPGARNVEGSAVLTIRGVGQLDRGPEVRDLRSVDLHLRLLLPHELLLLERGNGASDPRIDDPLQQRSRAARLSKRERLIARDERVAIVDILELRIALESGAGDVVLAPQLFVHALAVGDETVECHGDKRFLTNAASLSVLTRSCSSVSRSRTVTVWSSRV